MPILVYFGKSKRKDKKYVMIFKNPDKTIHFGAEGYEDYTIHKNYNRKINYINRHKKNEDWNDPLTAGALSRWILWNKTSLENSLKDYIKRFKIEDRRK
jgi:hypothetical protein